MLICFAPMPVRAPNPTYIYFAAVFPTAKCRLRLLKLERIKDFLLLEKEYIRNQEVFKVGGWVGWVPR